MTTDSRPRAAGAPPPAGAPAAPGAVHRLANAIWQVGVLPGTGASLASGRIRHGDGWVDLLRPTPPADHPSVEACASFLLVPWSNRIAGGVLPFRGRAYRLRVNADDGTAIHGTAREFPWQVGTATDTCLEARFDTRRFSGVNYPWPFTAHVTYRLEGPRLTVTLRVRNEHHRPIPAGLGHHPYFARSLAGAGDEACLELPFAEHYPLRAALPTGEPTPVTGRVDFRSLRALGSELVDDCLTGRVPGTPVRIAYPASGREVTLGADDVFSHLVVYLPPRRDWFAVEPVTHVNDAFRLHDRGADRTGTVVLGPGETLSGSVWIEVTG